MPHLTPRARLRCRIQQCRARQHVPFYDNRSLIIAATAAAALSIRVIETRSRRLRQQVSTARADARRLEYLWQLNDIGSDRRA